MANGRMRVSEGHPTDGYFRRRNYYYSLLAALPTEHTQFRYIFTLANFAQSEVHDRLVRVTRASYPIRTSIRKAGTRLLGRIRATSCRGANLP